MKFSRVRTRTHAASRQAGEASGHQPFSEAQTLSLHPAHLKNSEIFSSPLTSQIGVDIFWAALRSRTAQIKLFSDVTQTYRV